MTTHAIGDRFRDRAYPITRRITALPSSADPHYTLVIEASDVDGIRLGVSTRWRGRSLDDSHTKLPRFDNDNVDIGDIFHPRPSPRLVHEVIGKTNSGVTLHDLAGGLADITRTWGELNRNWEPGIGNDPQPQFQPGDQVRTDDGRTATVIYADAEGELLQFDDQDAGVRQWYKHGVFSLTLAPKPRRVWKLVAFDGSTRNDFVWPLVARGQAPVVVELPEEGIITTNTGACPTVSGDGLCLAKTLAGATSARLPTDSIGLWCEVDEEDILGEDDHKMRVRRVTVTGTFNPRKAQDQGLIR